MKSLLVRRTCWAASLSLAFLLTVAPVLWAQTVTAGPSGDAKVDLNTASQATLEKLPGVDQNTAKRIIAHRPYSSVADLSKSGVPAGTIETITPFVKVGPLGKAAATTGNGVEKAAAGIEKGADATATGVEKGVSGASKGVEKGAAATASAAGSVDRAMTGAARVPPQAGMVWADSNTKIYHKEGDAWYGTTKKGKWLTEKEAIKQGYRAVVPPATIGQ